MEKIHEITAKYCFKQTKDTAIDLIQSTKNSQLKFV